MTAQIPYHSGILVADIGEAAARFTAELGYEFNEPTSITVPRFDDRLAGTEGEVTLSAVYSRSGPHRLELIAAQGEGIYSASRAGLHHLGIWESAMPARLATLEATHDTVVEAVLWRRDGGLSAIYARSASTGTRLEYVNDDRREALERWFDTGVFS
ncbi:hypothetical protein GDN83_23105 [Gordonia jinghuaiqii]|uniref:VOC family protein n=1 Tax=Gordonia jinghuaiqii TaxID=2758710 RepID=A0A7D7LZG7_9ACTN|nr:VOC family protein [Gordonia jinghuaiqii]MCR5980576.1 hypothetical protein [Gordonia jinghuaiqii]QMT02636.1 VOC family protein [Gordonia jinghuaiqii]